MCDQLRRVAVPNWQWRAIDLLRQTHSKLGICGNTLFVRGAEADCDFILMGMTDNEESKAVAPYPKERRILVVMENPAIWSPSLQTIDAAGIIAGPFRSSAKDGRVWVRSQPAVPWFYGVSFATDSGLEHVPLASRSDLTDLTVMSPPTKTKLLSIVLSGKQGALGYDWRIRLAESVKNALGSECDIYGFGHNPIGDKKEALDQYKFTLAIENDEHEYYWTEKLADAYLGFAIPIYSGDPRVQKDFKGKIHQIRYGSDLVEATKKVVRIVIREDKSDEIALLENRSDILHKHNLFYMIDRIIHEKGELS